MQRTSFWPQPSYQSRNSHICTPWQYVKPQLTWVKLEALQFEGAEMPQWRAYKLIVLVVLQCLTLMQADASGTVLEFIADNGSSVAPGQVTILLCKTLWNLQYCRMWEKNVGYRPNFDSTLNEMEFGRSTKLWTSEWGLQIDMHFNCYSQKCITLQFKSMPRLPWMRILICMHLLMSWMS